MNNKMLKKMMPYLFLMPFVAFFIIFMLYPIGFSMVLCVSQYKGASMHFTGLSNFKYVLTDKLFYKSLTNTFVLMIIQVPIQTFLALVIAELLNNKTIKGLGFFRMIVFMPILLDSVSYSIIFGRFFNYDNGIVNNIIRMFGGEGLQWMNISWLARMVLIIAITWRWTGYNTIIMLGGLQNIPLELYESAQLDGAGTVKQFIYITIPQIKPIIVFAIILSVTGMLQLFTEPYLLTGGGPVNSTMTVVQYLYQKGFKSFDFGAASAGSYVLVIIIAIMTFVQMKMGKED